MRNPVATFGIAHEGFYGDVTRGEMMKHTASKRRVLRALAIPLIAGSVVAAGEGGLRAASDTTEGSAGALAEEQVLRARLAAAPESLDPAFVDRLDAELMAYNIFDGLVAYDDEGGFVPDLAESWTSSDDLTQWTFELQQGVQFHNGYGEMTSDDVRFSYERIQDPELASFFAIDFENVESIETPDDYTVVFNLTEPDALFLHSVAHFHGGDIVSRAAVEELGDQFGANPVGTGPFFVETFDPGNLVFVLQRNDEYWGEPPTLERVELTVVDDNEAAAIALENGEFDMAIDISGDQRLGQLEEAGFQMITRERSNLVTMLNPGANPAFADERVRKAIAHCVDFTTIIEETLSFREARSYNFLPPTLPEFTDDVPHYDYDPELGRQLLEEAGYGEGLTVKRLIRGTDGVEDRDLLEQEYLAECGITEEFETVEVNVFSERRFQGDFEIATRSVNEPNIDFIVTSLLHPDSFPPAGLNGSQYSNDEVTALIEEARGVADEEARTALYREIQTIVMGELPYIPENTLRQFWPTWDYVSTPGLNVLASMDFSLVSIGVSD
jgi:peptide/nickel transport system substrate-binding protein